MKKLLLFALVLSLPSSLFAGDVNRDGLNSLLVPIAFSSTQTPRGAYGTLWASELWFSNSSTTGVQSLQPTGICAPICPIGYPASTIGRITGVESNLYNGAILHVPADLGSQFQVSARLLELSRKSQPTGVDIPVVDESEYFRGERWLLGVPSSPDLRSALRVYDPRALNGTSVAVDFIATDGSVISSKVLRPGDDPRAGRAGLASAATVASVLSITDDVPELRQHERFHVRLRPVQSDREYWAMVSVTHNDTQHVLLITSQP